MNGGWERLLYVRGGRSIRCSMIEEPKISKCKSQVRRKSWRRVQSEILIQFFCHLVEEENVIGTVTLSIEASIKSLQFFSWHVENERQVSGRKQIFLKNDLLASITLGRQRTNWVVTIFAGLLICGLRNCHQSPLYAQDNPGVHCLAG